MPKPTAPLLDFSTASVPWGGGAVVLEAVETAVHHFTRKASTTRGLTSAEHRVVDLLRGAERVLRAHRDRQETHRA